MNVKFRGKELEDDRWVYGYYIKYPEEVNQSQIMEHSPSGTSWYFHEIDDKTVGMFTGLTDKHDKEIYSGDLIKVEMVSGTVTGLVFYNKDSACFEFKIDEDDSEVLWYRNEHFEVVGNIHEEEVPLF